MASTEAEAGPERVLQLGMGYWASKTLLSAVELGLFTELSAGPLDLAALQARLGLHPRSARDFLDALVALGMLERDANGRYANTAETGRYLDRGKPTYVGGMLEMANRRLWEPWGRLTEALRTGRPQNEARDGGELFEAIYADPATLESFLRAMTGVSLPTATAIAAAFDWSEAGSFADIGCAQGGFAVALANAHPHLTGIGFDLPTVRPVFERYVDEQGLGDRLRFRPGDFFSDELPSADVLVMGHILHDWDLPTKRMLLDKAHRALPDGGALIVYDAVIDDDRRQNAFGLLMSLNMLIETAGGFDYTGSDCVRWMADAGFRDRLVVPLGSHSMIVGRK
jgi:hypothetical protein